MNVWCTAPIADLPQLTLQEWGVFEVQLPTEAGRWTRHFVGFSNETGHGQVSSPVETFDPATRSGVTRSGRVYQLRGRPGSDLDVSYVWSCWKALNGVAAERVVNDEVLADIQRAVPGPKGSTSATEVRPKAKLGRRE